ncbi:MAG: UvrB/UvrC motif-containing protein [Candidatus Heimdallarchaeota archaeon]|nr:UvrB/UvrC motif-containing protein [Candidatus Heimdallarchaeota archaeon]
MICQVCGKNEATIHLTEIVNSQMVELHICEECAKDKAVDLVPPIAFTDILSGLVDFTAPKDPYVENITCPNCKLTFESFKKNGRLGCAMCYESFKTALLPLIQKVHNATHHLGKRPSHLGGSMNMEIEIKELTEKLKNHIGREEYEDAAQIRDKIKMLQKKIKNEKERS